MNEHSASQLQALRLETRLTQTVAKFIAAGGLLYLAAILWVGRGHVMAAMSDLGGGVIVLGVLVSISSYLCRFARWEYTLLRLGNSVPRWRHLGIYISGLALTATPGKVGETFRSVLLLRQGVVTSHSLAAFLIDRASDVLGVCLLGGAAAMVAGKTNAWLWGLGFLALWTCSCTFAYFLTKSSDILGKRGIVMKIKLLPVQVAKALFNAWASVWTPNMVLAFALVALVAYGMQAMVFVWFCQLLGTNVLPADCVLIFVQATLFGAASMLPGGLGAMESAIVYQLGQHGVDYSVAISLAIAIRLVTLWVGVLVGLIALVSVNRRTDKKLMLS